MADPSGQAQTGSSVYTKTFLPYQGPSKNYQPYVASNAPLHTSGGGSKYSEFKTDEGKNKFSFNSVAVNQLSSSANGIYSPRAETAPMKQSAQYMQSKHLMKGSAVTTQAETLPKQAKYEPQHGYHYEQPQKKIPTADMKFSNIELGGESGVKMPSFLNKDKKSAQERPQSSTEGIGVKGSAPNAIKTSYGNMKKQRGLDKSPDAKDPTLEWSKRMVVRKKQRIFILDDFQLIRDLGSGKYGKVYLALDKQTGFICALKVLEKAHIKYQQITQQLIRELKIQTFLNHSNIIKMYGFFDDQSNIYLVMEAATGGQLLQHLKKHTAMPEVKAAAILRQVCQALSELHSHRIIHRDIKPENIVLYDNVIKLCDFGWSVYMDSALRTTFCGTPLYVGPEILKGNDYDEKIDIWSLGVMMYEMLVGESPFAITKEEELIKIVKDEVKIPPYIEISEQAKHFVLSCLQKNPDLRLSIRELLNHQFFKKYPEKADKKLGL